MTLREKLEARKAASADKIPAHVKAVMGRSLEELRHSGIVGRALSVGDEAPDFTLPNAGGGTVHLAELLTAGPVVISFYRGGWCPYCNLELAALQEAVTELEEAGGGLVAISPNLPDESLTTVERHALGFPVLSDVGNVVARRFGLVFEVPDDLEAVYRAMGHDIGKVNGTDRWEIPLPAIYVVDPAGAIRFAFVDADYRNRAEPADIVEVLRTL